MSDAVRNRSRHPDRRSTLRHARIVQIEPRADQPGQVSVIARLNGDQFLVIRVAHREMEERGLMVGGWARLADRDGTFELA